MVFLLYLDVGESDGCVAHTQSESAAQQQLFLYEPDLTQHLAELIHHDRNVPVSVQIAAVNALDGIARYRHRSTEVLAAVNANVSHGILMGSLRKAVEEINKPGCEWYLPVRLSA